MELNQRFGMIKELQPGSLFTQGIIEGFASVKEGDNLYEKLGAMEIIVQDGVIQTIRAVGALPGSPIS